MNHIGVILQKLQPCASVLRVLELNQTGDSDFSVSIPLLGLKRFDALTTLVVPSTRLRRLAENLAPEYGIVASTIEKIEVIVQVESPNLFGHMVEVVCTAVIQMKYCFPRLSNVKLTLPDTDGEDLCTPHSILSRFHGYAD